MFYVYLLKNEVNNIYYGSTIDLKTRILKHNKGEVFSIKGHTWKLIYYEAFLSEKDARLRESKLKQHGNSLRQLKGRLKNSLYEI
jgi:predicted GIY-YIG superfamily endonuclease